MIDAKIGLIVKISIVFCLVICDKNDLLIDCLVPGDSSPWFRNRKCYCLANCNTQKAHKINLLRAVQ